MENLKKTFEDCLRLETEKLDVLVQLGRDLNEDVLGQMLTLHFETTSQIIQELQSSFLKKDFPQLARLAHKFKSNSGQVGLQRLHKMSDVLENLCQQQNQNWIRIENIIQEIIQESNATNKLLNQYAKVG
ncbi:MAG: hypothetical protein A2622_02100 [Bdellovibrionales bacterium RIFCSPHIGHO2_01_FULL_40_29]|nr:MAG: hypothetical protein A2622_02100 [Bdellovibrionales bacterium RIFCSPHIGHO2_01_FULL_40_29]OFZ33880.1 MAG: hypothetical protein A3D17_02520 [Bdellovibrionales bacterium RIFCSPHIGHO2_02_FULL_40_15]